MIKAKRRNVVDEMMDVSYPRIDLQDDMMLRTLDNDVIGSFQKDIIPVQRDFRVGIIHNDYNDTNIWMEDKEGVKGVIDIGDSISSCKVNEIAIACAYAMINSYGNTVHSLASATAMLRGFFVRVQIKSFHCLSTGMFIYTWILFV